MEHYNKDKNESSNIEEDDTEKKRIEETVNHEDYETAGQNCSEDQKKFCEENEDDVINLANGEATLILCDKSDSVEETSKSDNIDYAIKVQSKKSQRGLSKTTVPETKEVLQCNVCYKMFQFPSHLDRHFKTHFDEKSFFCDICKKSFSRLHHLKEHLRMHTNERPFVCKLCNKSFVRSTTLKRHYITHTNESSFKCKFCNKACVKLHDLEIHLRTHTNEKPYRCEFCEKMFCHLSNLNQHLRIHTNKKPFVCEICKKSFSRSNILKTHLSKHANSQYVYSKS